MTLDQDSAPTVTINGATLINGVADRPLSDTTVIVQQGRIRYVGPDHAAPHPEHATTVDAADRYLLPGLIDLHVHLFHPGFIRVPPKGSQLAYASIVAANNLRTALHAGITTVRSVTDPQHLDIALRTALHRGQLVGPRLQVAGRGICMTGGHASDLSDAVHEVDGPAAVRRAVRQEVKAGADWIKLLTSHRTDTPEFSQEEIDAGVEEAHRLGRKVAIHAANAISVQMAVRAGVDTIEHGSFLDEASAEEMARQGTVLVPTLWVKNHIPQMLEGAEDNADRMTALGMDSEALALTRAWFTRCVDQLSTTIPRAHSKGVLIGTGTDSVFPDQPWVRLPEEIAYLAHYGLSPMEAIRSATHVGAIALGLQDTIGSIQEGKVADMIMVDRDPLEDITALSDVSWVMAVGKVVPQRQEWARRPVADPLPSPS